MKITQLSLLTLFSCSTIYALDLPSTAVKAYDCYTCDKLAHETLHDNWSNSTLKVAEIVSNKQKSFSYRQKISAQQLQAGVRISTLAPGAIVRISPLQNKALPKLYWQTPKNQTLSFKKASALYSEGEVSEGSLINDKHQAMLQIKPELGFGRFILRGKIDDENITDAYLISVFDKFSSTYLEVSSDSLTYQFGERVNARISLQDEENEYSANQIEASLVGPLGQVTPMTVNEKKPNQFEASAIMDSEMNDHGEHWYIEVKVDATFESGSVKRNGHSAFSYSIPSAAITSLKKIASQPLTLEATVNVASPSRYSLQSVLFTQNNKGRLKPLETAQTGQWLEPGVNTVQFIFDNSGQLADDNLYLGDLRLIDYGQLKMVYQYHTPIQLTQLVE